MTLLKIKEDIFTKAKAEYHKEWLKYYDLKIGDKVKARFPSESGTAKNSYHRHHDCLATIKQNEDGTLFLESTEEISHSKNVSNGRLGRPYRSWWEYYKKIDHVEVDRMISENDM